MKKYFFFLLMICLTCMTHTFAQVDSTRLDRAQMKVAKNENKMRNKENKMAKKQKKLDKQAKKLSKQEKRKNKEIKKLDKQQSYIRRDTNSLTFWMPVVPSISLDRDNFRVLQEQS